MYRMHFLIQNDIILINKEQSYLKAKEKWVCKQSRLIAFAKLRNNIRNHEENMEFISLISLVCNCANILDCYFISAKLFFAIIFISSWNYFPFFLICIVFVCFPYNLSNAMILYSYSIIIVLNKIKYLFLS